jgi:uncharacterized circularly permuted ATP-grasp superfamily protein/uncharacterized alpha-E superfamily protein
MSSGPQTAPLAGAADLLGPGYRSGRWGYDEMLSADGSVREHWAPFMRAIGAVEVADLERRRQEVLRLLRENGVTYVVHGDDQGGGRSWLLDPVPLVLDRADWDRIEAGLTQRADLLNLIFKDLYGPRTLLADASLPPELLWAHEGFHRACDGVGVSTERPLAICASDLARGPDGRMWVLGDRTQAPSGAGYALENRTTIVRAMAGPFHATRVRRLASFFRSLQAGLASLAGDQRGDPLVVVLTPGPWNETYFEHAYLATYLGYPLVQGDDLTVSDGRVWLKSLDGLQPVDVILRRVDEDFCDPLELRADSRLGVPGLVEAARRGTVVIANPLGSGVLENPGLMPFLPGIARSRLGADLLLPSVATWWCGQAQERAFVLENLATLVVKPINRSLGYHPVFGDRLTRAELAEWRARIRAAPHLYVGQERVQLSTTPSLIAERLEPRHAVLRCFVAANTDGWCVMPGGLTRTAPDPGNLIVSNQQGGVSKDTWVPGGDDEPYVSLWRTSVRATEVLARSGGLASRVAENLYWVGRYAERGEGVARLLRTVLAEIREGRIPSDAVDASARRRLLQTLTHLTGTYPGFVGDGAEVHVAHPEGELYDVALDGERPGSLVAVLRSLLVAAYGVRDRWSTDSWRVLNAIEGLHAQLHDAPRIGFQRIQNDLDTLVTYLAAFAGLGLESVTREAGWVLLDSGRRIERSVLLMGLVRHAVIDAPEELLSHGLGEAVLRTTENLITFRRRYRSALEAPALLDLLFLDDANPRSLVYQLRRLERNVDALPRPQGAGRLSEPQRLILEAVTRLRLAEGVLVRRDRPARGRVDGLLTQIGRLLAELSDALTSGYFTHVQAPHQLGEP